MRTAILTGCFFIGECINQGNYILSESNQKLYGTIIIVCIISDIIDFVIKITEKTKKS